VIARRCSLKVTHAGWGAGAGSTDTENRGKVELTVQFKYVQTKFLWLCEPVSLGDRIDDWRICWLEGLNSGGLTTDPSTIPR
jgi:hypothetical protein